MKVIILAAGQGTRLRPLTDDRPKCMVEVSGKSLLNRQLETMYTCGIHEEDIYILTGYKKEALTSYMENTKINFINNDAYESTNMVCTLMCAEKVMQKEEDILISYGDIIYTPEVLQRLMDTTKDMSVVVDNGWYEYWAERCENPLDDAETLILDAYKNIVEIGQKTEDICKVQSQYIGLMRFRKEGLQAVLALAHKAKRNSAAGEALWRTSRTYEKMYMTDLLQGLIEEGNKLQAVEIRRGWYEVDCYEDIKLVEKEID